MTRALFLLVLALFTAQFSIAQEKVFFDKQGKSCAESDAYYYRVALGEGRFVSKYVLGESTFFEGNIVSPSTEDESRNVYVGECIWYFKNGKKKSLRNYNDKGVLQGRTLTYFESGKIKTEEIFENGFLKEGILIEYDESGAYTKVFREDFSTNRFDWNLEQDSLSIARLEQGKLYLESLSNAGTARMINIPQDFETFSIEGDVDLRKQNASRKAGLIFGFKDWQNYWYFMVSRDKYYIGMVYEGLSQTYADGDYIVSEKLSGDHTLKVISGDSRWYFSIDGTVHRSVKDGITRGRNAGFVVSGKNTYGYFDQLVVKEFYSGSSGIGGGEANAEINASGSGLLLNAEGYFVTNYHVIEDSNEILVDVTVDGNAFSCAAKVVQVDKVNDLAILKIDDPKCPKLNAPSFGVKANGGVETGMAVYTLGFPLAFSGMGVEPKFTDGRISAKTGYEGAINAFQTTIPVQPGSSGGPVFNSKGELVGIINAKIFGSDNVSYGIKVSYLLGLIESVNESIPIQEASTISELSLEEQIKKLKESVVLVKVK